MSIASQPLFRIVNPTTRAYYDFTSHITAPDYEVNSSPVYEEWTDGNYKKHRVVARNRVSGTLTLNFIDKVLANGTHLTGIDEYERFMRLYKSHGQSDTTDVTSSLNYFILSVYVNNMLTLYEGDFYMDITPANEMPFIIGKQSEVSGFQVTIEEV